MDESWVQGFRVQGFRRRVVRVEGVLLGYNPVILVWGP